MISGDLVRFKVCSHSSKSLVFMIGRGLPPGQGTVLLSHGDHGMVRIEFYSSGLGWFRMSHKICIWFNKL